MLNKFTKEILINIKAYTVCTFSNQDAPLSILPGRVLPNQEQLNIETDDPWLAPGKY